jgi:predicted XRE-type DNA-binding protein
MEAMILLVDDRTLGGQAFPMRRAGMPASAWISAGRSVFYDLGFDGAEARVLEMRADLMAALREHVEKRGWTQSEAAKKAGHHSAEGSRHVGADRKHRTLPMRSHLGYDCRLNGYIRAFRPGDTLFRLLSP